MVPIARCDSFRILEGETWQLAAEILIRRALPCSGPGASYFLALTGPTVATAAVSRKDAAE